MATYYVNPALASNTGTGTVGDPFGDLQYALNSVTRAAAGDTFILAAGTTEILAANLSYATYGTPTAAGWLRIVGAGSGATINCNSFAPSFPSFTFCQSITFSGSYAAGAICGSARRFSALHCDFQGPTSGDGGIGSAITAWIKHCRFTGTSGMQLASGLVDRCYFANSTRGVYMTGGAVRRSIFSGNFGYAPIDNTVDAIVASNIFAGSAGKTGVYLGTGDGAIITDNLFAGYSGTGEAIGVPAGRVPRVVSGNAVYNCGAEIDTPAAPVLYEPGVILAADPFINAAGGDYSLTDVAIAALLYEQGWLGLTTTPDSTQYIGAWQPSGGGGSGGIGWPLLRRIAALGNVNLVRA